MLRTNEGIAKKKEGRMEEELHPVSRRDAHLTVSNFIRVNGDEVKR